MCIYIIGLPAVRYIPVISAREGTAPAEGDFWTECWLVKSAASMWMGQQWHFQAIRYVNSQRERRPPRGKGKWQEDEWNMRWWTLSVSAFAKKSYFPFVDRAHFFMPFFLFFFPLDAEKQIVRYQRWRCAEEDCEHAAKSNKRCAPCLFIILCHKMLIV